MTTASLDQSSSCWAFATPWHWCVHGLGLADGMRPLRPEREHLLALSRQLVRTAPSAFNRFCRLLLQQVLGYECQADRVAGWPGRSPLVEAFAEVSDPIERANACALWLLAPSNTKPAQDHELAHLTLVTLAQLLCHEPRDQRR